MKNHVFLMRNFMVILCLNLLLFLVGCRTEGSDLDEFHQLEKSGASITLMLPGDVPMELVSILSGSFVMGSPEDEQGRFRHEGPQRTVNIGYDFYLGKFTVTKVQWEAVMGTTPWDGEENVLDHQDSPAVYVSWNDIRETGGFLDTLNAHLASTGQDWEVRLPSEAEWEYAARAGTTTRFYWGDDPDETEINDYTWYGHWFYRNTEGAYAHVVGQKLSNAWGLYDMSGNVWEWCEDDWHGDYNGAPTDGSARVESPRASNRIHRGGCWADRTRNCRSAHRSADDPSNRSSINGFRVLAVRK